MQQEGERRQSLPDQRIGQSLDRTAALSQVRLGIGAMAKILGFRSADYQINFGMIADGSGKSMYGNKLIVFLPESREFLINSWLFDKISEGQQLGREKALIIIARSSAFVLEAHAVGDAPKRRAQFLTLAHGLEYIGKACAAQTLLAVIGASAMFDPDGANWDTVPVRMLSHMIIHDRGAVEEIHPRFMGEEQLAENITVANRLFKEKKDFISYALYYASLMPKLGDGEEHKKECFRDMLGDIMAAVLLIDHTKQETEQFVSGFYRDLSAFRRLSEKSLPRIRRKPAEPEEKT